ncbi:unnamed protein product [Rotaria sordida]|uniref:DDE Tnp4 domain-containing protein n=2 Tax=Rotaria sordida TaxID=392033 RepID=A0A814S509_9BILA|nr:unnamed protein product [Rotaria sordida]CAF1142250.1 unnamed protein product [Rotaria sordida]CAF1175124.1 unnamed protein product [Rotaria sordida]CAF1179187.1 unnamed protein product [Rotaria sordida]CAF1478608.1 unnamed protein product [Rotaria sordida]
MTQKINNPTTVQPVPKSFDLPLSSIDISAIKSNNIKIIPTTGIGSKEVKCRFWTENETITFINIWNDYYPKLTTGGSRHAPIHQLMANELNKMLEIDDSTGADMKSKIGNLTTEYRHKKKDMDHTGGSPSSWPYLEFIDKLLGERPYIDDSLLSDFIIVEEEQVVKNVDQASAPDLNLTQISEQADDLVQLKTNSDDTNNPDSVNSVTSPSSPATISIPKSDSPVQMVLKTKKNASSKKKRASEMKMDLMKELFGKIESASEAAARSEIKILELLEKQTHLQAQSVANEREFLSLFKTCALYALGSSSEFRTISHLFGIGKSTTGENLHEFCSVLVEMLFHRFIKFPKSPDEIKYTINGFYTKFGYPMCIGALDGTHFAIKPPLGYEVDYYNYKIYHSIIMLATVNADLLFTYVNRGAPGKCNESSIYNRSTLSQVIEDPTYENHFMIMDNTKIRCHFIADSAFSLTKTLIKPFPERPNMPKKLLHKKMEFNLCNTTNIVKVATILHNLCVMNGDKDEIDWDTPNTVHKKPSCNIHTNDGTDVREALVNFFLLHPL